MCLISLKLENLARRCRTTCRFQNFWMATNLFLFIQDVFYAQIRQRKKSCVAQKTVMSTKKCSVNVMKQSYESHKKICCGNKKITWHPTEDSCWLNMFSVAQTRNTCLQKMVPAAYKYMFNWLKEFCVARKIIWCRTKIKDDVHKCY